MNMKERQPEFVSEGEPAQRVLHRHSGSDQAKITPSELTGIISTRNLGSGAADSTTFLRGDGTWAIPTGGLLGYAQVTADQGSITTEVDLTGLSITVDVPAATYIKITGKCRLQGTSGGAGNETTLRIKEGATVLGTWNAPISNANNGYECMAVVVLVPSVGSHTYKLAVVCLGGGTGTMTAAADNPAFILAEMIS